VYSIKKDKKKNGMAVLNLDIYDISIMISLILKVQILGLNYKFIK